jgi:Glycosyl hydrolase family 1
VSVQPLDVGGIVGTRAEALPDETETARDLALGHARITVSWARTQPKPGAIDGSVVEELRSAAHSLRGAGIAVWVCMLTPDVPRWFDNDGGFTDAATARHWWPRWVESLSEALADDVDGWVPFEAPFAMANRLEPSDPRRHGEIVDTLLVAWRDAWRILQGPMPIACSLDVRALVVPRNDVVAAEAIRREDHLRWHTWLRALRDGTITIPGRADRELPDLAGACDQLGIAVSGADGGALEGLLHRVAEQGPDRPLAVTFRPTGPDREARAEAASDAIDRCRALASSMPISRLTIADLESLSVALG